MAGRRSLGRLRGSACLLAHTVRVDIIQAVVNEKRRRDLRRKRQELLPIRAETRAVLREIKRRRTVLARESRAVDRDIKKATSVLKTAQAKPKPWPSEHARKVSDLNKFLAGANKEAARFAGLKVKVEEDLVRWQRRNDQIDSTIMEIEFDLADLKK